jgi:sec-independent protein translocase protein TatC
MTQKRVQPKQAKNHNSLPSSLTFSDHIRELRRRVMWVALVFVIASALAYNYHDQLVDIVMAPLRGEKLVYLTPGGGFSFIFQITMYAGLIAAGPTFTYQLYRFLRPALPEHAKRSAFRIAMFATLLMIGGVSYGYFVAVPSALTFLSTFAGTDIIPNLTADSYLNFFLAYIGGLALLFQLPLLLIFWNWVKPMDPGGLLKSERFIILFAFIAAALITPTPDVVNQAMIAVPLIAIYQIGVVVVLISYFKTKRSKKVKLPDATTSIAPQPVTAPVQIAAQHTEQIHTVTPSPQKKPISRQSARRIDGFGNRFSGQALSNRHSLAVPSRQPAPSRQQTPLLQRRSALRIDGMSPL